MSTKLATPTQSPWTGTNIYYQLILLIASFFGGMSDETAGMIVAAVMAAIGAFAAVRSFIVNAKFTPGKTWIADPNNWSYLGAVLVGISPKFSELLPALKGLTEALFAGNWAQVITGALTLISLVFYTFFKK